MNEEIEKEKRKKKKSKKDKMALIKKAQTAGVVLDDLYGDDTPKAKSNDDKLVFGAKKFVTMDLEDFEG